jgi:hypothetical protein
MRGQMQADAALISNNDRRLVAIATERQRQPTP